MISLKRFAEPPEFEEQVRRPGKKFLVNSPLPTTKQWGSHSYWRNVKSTLYDLYGGICSYCCIWISPRGNEHVDHYVPKSKDPSLAYEWSNYRLASGRINGSKRDYEIIDPFEMEDGWFVLDFGTMEVKVGDNVPDSKRTLVKYTIDKLKLNDLNTTIKDRRQWLNIYIEKQDMSFLEKYAPFIAAELKRQKLKEKIMARPLWPI